MRKYVFFLPLNLFVLESLIKVIDPDPGDLKIQFQFQNILIIFRYRNTQLGVHGNSILFWLDPSHFGEF